MDSSPSSTVLSRRHLVRRGVKLAYMAPVVLVAMHLEAACTGYGPVPSPPSDGG